MNKEQFLQELSRRLWQLSGSERKKVIEFYSEMIDERIEDGMDEVCAVAALGSMDEIARETQGDAEKAASKPSRNFDDVVRVAMNGAEVAINKATQSIDQIFHEAFGTDEWSAQRESDVRSQESAEDRFQMFSEEIHNLDFDCANADIHVLHEDLPEGVTAQLHIPAEFADEFICSLTDGLLKIDHTPFSSSGKKLKIRFNRRNIRFDTCLCTLTLANSAVQSGRFQTTSGDISVEDLRFADSLEILSASGDTELERIQVGKTLSASTTNGEQSYNDVRSDEIRLSTASGDVELNEIYASTLCLESKNGNVCLENIWAEQYLSLTTISGDVELSDVQSPELTLSVFNGDLSLENIRSANARLKTTSGDVELNDFETIESNNPNPSETDLLIEVSSGDLSLSNLRCTKNAAFKTASGDVELEDSTFGMGLGVFTASGDVSLSAVSVHGSTAVKVTSGDIELDGVEADHFQLATTNGDLSGTLDGPEDAYNFQVSSLSGDVRVPHTRGERIVDVRTVSGDVHLRAN